MTDKSPRQSLTKKSTKGVKAKRAEKKQKQASKDRSPTAQAVGRQ